MSEDTKHDSSHGKLAGALCSAQAAITHASKDSTNPHFKSRYADLASVWGAIRKPLTDRGLSITQGMKRDGDQISLVTKMMHDSGESITFEYPIILPADKLQNPQMLGAAMTYARRYSLAAIVGIAQDDDDGNSVSIDTRPINVSPGAPIQNRDVAPITTDRLASYKLGFGKYKGRTLDEIGPVDIGDYMNYIQKNLDPDKPVKANVQEFLEMASEYLRGCAPTFDADENIPF